MPCHVIEMHTETIWNLMKFAYICSWGFTVFSLFFSASSVSRTTCRLLWLTTSNCQLWATGSYGKCLEAFWHEKVCLQHGQHWHSLNGSEGEEKQVLLFSPQRAPECLCFIPDWMQSRFHWKSYKWIGRPWLHSAATVLGAPRHAKHTRCDETFL